MDVENEFSGGLLVAVVPGDSLADMSFMLIDAQLNIEIILRQPSGNFRRLCFLRNDQPNAQDNQSLHTGSSHALAPGRPCLTARARAKTRVTHRRLQAREHVILDSSDTTNGQAPSDYLYLDASAGARDALEY